jgi:ABC-type dipeptide/oligopeptide/nickel transport system ATPase subunit
MEHERLELVRAKYGRRTGTDDVEYDDEIDPDDPDFDSDDDGTAPEYVKPVSLSSVKVTHFDRVKTGWPLFDETMGGGLIRGFIYLLGGDPGAGKSTLCLQISHAIQAKTRYVTAEEHADKIATRAHRIKISTRNIQVVRTKDIESALNVRRVPEMLVLDSLQKFAIDGHRGTNTPSEVMDLIEAFTRETNCITVVLSRVNKSGRIAGKNDLDHDSDATIQLSTPGRNARHKDPKDPKRYFHVHKNREGDSPLLIECTMTKQGISFMPKAVPETDEQARSRPTNSEHANKPTNSEHANKPTTHREPEKSANKPRARTRTPSTRTTATRTTASATARAPATREMLAKAASGTRNKPAKHVVSKQIGRRKVASSKR